MMANDGAASAYVRSLGEAMHRELVPSGVAVTVLLTSLTDVRFRELFGFAAGAFNSRLLSAEQCARAGLEALAKGRRVKVAGFSNQILDFAGLETAARMVRVRAMATTARNILG